MTRRLEEGVDVVNISIHMPHTWHDNKERGERYDAWYFNPHATYVA
mgnify:FL=1